MTLGGRVCGRNGRNGGRWNRHVALWRPGQGTFLLLRPSTPNRQIVIVEQMTAIVVIDFNLFHGNVVNGFNDDFGLRHGLVEIGCRRSSAGGYQGIGRRSCTRLGLQYGAYQRRPLAGGGIGDNLVRGRPPPQRRFGNQGVHSRQGIVVVVATVIHYCLSMRSAHVAHELQTGGIAKRTRRTRPGFGRDIGVPVAKTDHAGIHDLGGGSCTQLRTSGSGGT